MNHSHKPNSNVKSKFFDYNNKYEINYNTPLKNSPIIVAPVILSDFTINIVSHFQYNPSITHIKNIKSRVILTEVKLINNNSSIWVKGYIEKYDLISLNNKTFKKLSQVPFSNIKEINYLIPPINYNTRHNDNYIFFENLKKLEDYKVNIDLNSIKLYENNTPRKENTSPSLMLIKINIRLIQKQEFPIN